MEIKTPDKGSNIAEIESKEPNYAGYLIGFAVLLFAVIIGYNAFVVPDVDMDIKHTVDVNAVKAENTNHDSAKININIADKDSLTSINGIGEQTAEKIINYRETHGGFSSKEELMEISGIGEKIFEKIKDQITF